MNEQFACRFTYHFKNCFKIFSHWCSHKMNYLSHCLEKTKIIPVKYYDWLDKLKNGLFRISNFLFTFNISYKTLYEPAQEIANTQSYLIMMKYLKNLASWQFDLSVFIPTHHINGTRQFLNLIFSISICQDSCLFFVVAGWARDGGNIKLLAIDNHWNVYVERVIGGYCYH